MTVPVLFALIGSIILIGFLANLLFKVTKIPAVLVLVSIGVVLGPITGWIQHEALLTIAPFFGAIALLVILFEGGLELDIAHVVRHAPRAALFTVVVFGLSLAAVSLIAHVALGLPTTLSLMLGAVLGATSPAICMPVVSGLSVRDDVKTVIKLESAMGEVLLIVSVVLLIQSDQTGTTAAGWIGGFARFLAVALVVASIAGVLWSRLVGWLGREPLSYMLTLGVTCLLYFVVEELGGSPAIAVLVFGLLLANMQSIARSAGPHLRELFGIHLQHDQFVLGQFMVNITAELSFLMRTFFFVYLGLLLDFSTLSAPLAGWLSVIFVLLLVARRFGMALFRRSGAVFSPGEWQAIMALQPRGLATAVVAFMPAQAGVGGTAAFPLFAFAMIVLSNLFMTGGILFAERRLRSARESPEEAEDAVETVTGTPAESPLPAAHPDQTTIEPARRPPLFSPARDFENEPPPASFVDWAARVSGLRLADRETAFVELLRASYLSEPLFWVQAVLGAAICALGLVLGQTTIVIGGTLIVPAARPVLTTGLALASGDLYLLVKLAAKLLAFSAVTVAVSAALIDLLPFAPAMNEIVARTRPTILDFLVALFGGMSAAAIVARRQGPTIQYLPGAVVGLTLVPALCVFGFALTDVLEARVLRQAALQFSANLFAAVLGAGLVLLALGIHLAAGSPLVRLWKEEQLATPLARAVFRGLRLERAIGGTGSVRSRIIVVAVFLLLLVTPLQLALNQVRSELRARQAVAGALELFSIPNRSAVLGSAVTITDGQVSARLQVATNDLFGAADVARFEGRVAAETGRRTTLDLVQTVADVGNAGTLRSLLEQGRQEAAEPRRSVADALREVDNQVLTAVRDVPLPDGVRILGVRNAMGQHDPMVVFPYLADAELGADARGLVVRLLASRTQIEPSRIRLDWTRARHALRLTGARLDGNADTVLRDLHTVLTLHPDLTVMLDMPPGLSTALADNVAELVRQRLSLPAPPPWTPDPQAARRTIMLRLAARPS